MRRRYHVSVDDVRALAHPLRHRIVTNFNAESDGVDADDLGRTSLRDDAVPGQRDVSAAMPPQRPTSGSFLDPAIVARIGSLGLPAPSSRVPRRSATAACSKGSALSSASSARTCRATTPATIDWKLAARRERYYVKKFEEETNLE